MQATDRISLRTTPHAKAIIEQASNIMGVSMSHFILTTMYQKSLELINETPIWYASDADKALMNELLQDTAPANQALQDLLKLSTDRVEPSETEPSETETNKNNR